MTRFVVRFALPLLLVTAAGGPARAGEPGTTDLPVVPLTATPPARVWYGWQVLAADAAVAGLTAGCLASRGDDVCSFPILGFFGTGPFVHTIHRGGKRGRASLGMRLALPAIGAIIAAALTTCPSKEHDIVDLCGLDNVAIGAMSGMAVAIAIDSIWAFEDTAPTPSPTPPRHASWAITPTLKVSDNSAGFGLAGRF